MTAPFYGLLAWFRLPNFSSTIGRLRGWGYSFTSMSTALRIAAYLRKYPGFAIGTITAALLSTLLGLVYPRLTGVLIDDVIAKGRSARAHVVNLGHGVPPDCDPDVITRVVAHVHEQPAS